MTLSKYNKRRDFRSTSEPSGKKSQGKKNEGNARPSFVIQKHDATNLHYDLRLEIDGVLKSWAVPKGPSTDPSDKRLAIPTEDHPLDYGDFEGTIPDGEYGAGTVMIWDRGTIKNLRSDEDEDSASLKESWEQGKIKVALDGEKLQGGYALVRVGSGDMKGKWMLTKMDDDAADARRNPVNTETQSVASDRSLADIRDDESD